MKKKLSFLMLLAALLLPWASWAQELVDYQLAKSTTTYATIASTGTQLDSVYGDAGNQTIVMPFEFNIGERYIARGTRLRVRADGHLFFPPASTPTGIGSHFAYNYWTGTTYDGYSAIVPYLCTDGGMAQNASGAYWQLETSGGDSVLVVEFEHVYRWNNASTTDFNYQVRLHQGGVISITYGAMTNTMSTLTEINCLITNGLEDHILLSGSWANPTIAHPDAISYLTGVPASGTVLTFTPVFPTCPKVGNLTVVPSSYEAVVSWIETGTATAWEVVVSDANGVVFTQGVSTTSTTVSSLDPDSEYEVSVRAICGSGDTSFARTASFHTPCVALTDSDLPYSYGFEDATGNGAAYEMSPCWGRHCQGSTTNYPNPSSTQRHTGSYSMYMYNTSTIKSWATLPVVDATVPVNTLSVSFWAYKTSATYGRLKVGVMTNPDDYSTFVPVGSLQVSATSTWEFFEFPLTSYTGTGTYIAIMADSTSANYTYVDDVALMVTPICAAPTAAVISNITPYGATLTITDSANTGSYLIQVSGDSTFTETVYSNVFTFSGLEANHLYIVSVSAICSDGNPTSAAITQFRTACLPITSLPWTESFEGIPTGSSTSTEFVPCMNRLNGTASYYPYVGSTASYVHTGAQGLYWYCPTTSSTYQCMVLPEVDTDNVAMNTLQLRFWARATSTSYNPVFQVGVMTDPTDISTFQLVQNVVVGGNTTYAEFIVPFGQFEGYGQYVAIKAGPATSAWYATVDDLTLELMPTCPSVVDLEVLPTAGSAMLTWDYQNGYDAPGGYVVTYDSIGGSNPTELNVNAPAAAITGLAANTTYKVYVQADCGSGDMGAMDSIEFSTKSFDCIQLDPNSLDTVLFSTSTTGQTGCIAQSSYGNTAYQAIWTAAELTAAGLSAGPITGIDLGFTGCTSFNKEFTIFITNTSTTAISSTTFEVPTAEMRVYGPAAHPMNTSGWQHYNFTTPFNWDGVSSIIITTFMNQMGSTQTNSTGLTGYYVSAANRARYRYMDSTPFTLANVASAGTGASTYSYRAAIHFYSGDCQTYASCAAPALSTAYVTFDTVTLIWAPGNDETEWNVDYRLAGASTWTNAATGVTDNTYTFDNLSAGTDYEFRVSFTCDDNDNTVYASSIAVFTPCAPAVLPYSENFDAVSTNTTTAGNYGVLPNCWDYVFTASSTYQTGSYQPGVYYSTANANSGSFSLRLAGMGYFMLPEMPTTVDSLMLSLNVYITSASYGLIVGAMEDNGTFTPIDTLSPLPINTHNFFDVNMSSYNGTSRRIALRNTYGTSNTYSYVYIDDIYVDYIPTCPHVVNLAVDSVTESTVTLNWTAGGSETEWAVSGSNGFYATTTTNNYTVTGLASNTPYTFEVRALCAADDSSRSMSILARTACEPYMTLPYIDDFESYTTSTTASTGVHPSCWDWLMTGTSSYQGASYQPQLYYSTSTAYSHSGNYSLRLYGVSYTTLQQLPIDANMVSMGFWTRTSSTSYLLYVGVMSDPNDATTFDTVATITYAGSSVPEYHEIDFSNYTGTGRYIAFRNTHASYNYSYHYIDDIEVWKNSSCATPTDLMVSNISNNAAILGWVDTSNTYNGASIFWGTSPNRGAVTDSGSVSGSVNNFTLTGLNGSTTYYVWIQGECTAEPSRAMMTSFTTTPDCMPVEDLTVTSIGNHAFSLGWSAPSSGNTPNGYIVRWNQTGYDSVHVDTVTSTYYYAGNLEAATNYNYSVSTWCGNLVVEGETNYLTTTLCTEETTGEYATNFSALPVRAASPYSYTQQIYLAEELEGIDSISAVAFYNAGYAYNRRNVTVYLGNTSKSEFASATDFIPLSNLTQVYSGPYEGFDWYTMHFTQTFVRDVDSNLVLVVDDNTGTAWTDNTAYFASSNLVDTMRAIYASNTADITPANPTTGSSYLSQYRNHVIFTPADCQMTDCEIPVMVATATTDHSITVQWAVEQGASYTVDYRMVNTTAWNSFETNNTTGTSVVTLSPSETWEIRVGYSCDGDMVYGTLTAATLCGAAALPLVEDFESNGYGNYVRPCWVVGQTRFNGTDVYPRVTLLTGGDDFLFFLYHGAYLIMPRVNAPLDSLQLSFKLTQGGTNARLLIGVIADQSLPITSMVVLDTLVRSDIDPNTSTVNIDYTFDNLDSAYQNYHICFYDAFSDNYSFLNDIYLDYKPSCMPPTDVTVSAVTTTSATVSWTAPAEGEVATSYYVIYGPRYFTLGSPDADTVVATGTSVTINGLDHSSNYDVYVFTDCGLASLQSAASQVAQFTTECDAVTALPYTMNFDHVLPQGNTSAVMVPNCWSAAGVNGGAAPRVFYTTESSYTGSGNYCLYFNGEGIAALPEMSAALNTLAISFRDYNDNPLVYGLVIGTVGDTSNGLAAAFVPYDTLLFDMNTNAYNTTVYFNDYTGTANRIAIKAYNNLGGTCVHYIDNVVVDVAPSCIPPQNIHTTTLLGNEATLVWTQSNASSYTVIYGVHGSSTTTTDYTGVRSITLTGLTPQTQYDVQVIGGCGDTVPYSFTTPCAAVALPYVENFDSYTTSTTAATGVQVPCWNYIMTGSATYQTSTYQPQIYYSSTYANSGSYSLRLYGNSYTMLPPMPTSLDSLQIVFNHYITSASYLLQVGVVEGNTFIPIQTITSPTSTHTEQTVNFSSYTGPSRRIAFRNYYTTATTYYSYHYIDDIEVDYIPTCPKIVNLQVTDYTDNTATLYWETTGPESEWMVSFGSTDTIVFDTVPTIYGLLPDSTYTFAVRPVCGIDDTGRARYITVHTTCSPVALPYQQNFDNVTTSTSTTNYGLVPDCWNYIMTGTSTYQTGTYLPRVYYSSTYSNSGSYCYYMYGVGYHILPPMPTSLDSLELTFSRYFTSTYYGLEVGVMEGNTFVPIETISGPTSTHTTHTVYFGTYTGTSRTIAFRNYYTTSTTTYYAGNYIDDIDVHYLPSCPRVLDVHASTASTTSITVDWIDQVSASQWQIEYGSLGHALGSGTTVTVSSHPYTISGLTELTNYDVYVRPICSATDTGAWSFQATLSTAMCDNATEFYTGDGTGTTYYAPVNNYFKYTLTETIIDSAELAGIGAISYIAYKYNYATAMTDKTDVTIYLQPTTKSVFTGNTDVVQLDTNTAVKVYQGNLNCVQGWNYFAFDTTYMWDGHSNLMVIVDDNSNDYNASSYIFSSTNCTGNKTLAYYSDSQNPDVHTVTSSYDGTKAVYTYRPTMKLISCGASCPAPSNLTATSITYNEVTVTWQGFDSTEVGIHHGLWDETGATMATVTNGTYTFTGLTPNTQYTVAARTLCEDDMTSEWVYVTFTTDELPCFAPTNIEVSNETFSGGRVTWEPQGNENEWLVNVYRTGVVDTNITVINTPMCNVSGLYADMSYTISVASVCGGIDTVWCDTTATLTTTACLPPATVTAVANGRNAIVTWEGSGANEYHVLWFVEGFTTGADSVVVTNGTTNATIEDLEPGESYDIYVYAYCDGQRSAQAGQAHVTITGIDDVNSSLINLYPNPANTTVTVDGIKGEAIVTIVDMNGRTVFSEKAVDKLTIDLNGMAQGAYFVRITGEKTSAIRKLIVK